MALSRGDLVTIVAQGDYGKPRPAVVIQANEFLGLKSTMVLPLTSDAQAEANLFRVTVYPDPKNGLRMVSQVMVDKAMPIPTEKIGACIGKLSRKVMRDIDRCIVTFFGVGGIE
jgi:mRNA interferase MazF